MHSEFKRNGMHAAPSRNALLCVHVHVVLSARLAHTPSLGSTLTLLSVVGVAGVPIRPVEGTHPLQH